MIHGCGGYGGHQGGRRAAEQGQAGAGPEGPEGPEGAGPEAGPGAEGAEGAAGPSPFSIKHAALYARGAASPSHRSPVAAVSGVFEDLDVDEDEDGPLAPRSPCRSPGGRSPCSATASQPEVWAAQTPADEDSGERADSRDALSGSQQPVVAPSPEGAWEDELSEIVDGALSGGSQGSARSSDFCVPETQMG